MNYEEIQGLSSKQIKDKFALPYESTHICDVELPAGTEVRFGIANEVPEWGLGGGLQFDLMGQYFNSFVIICNKKVIFLLFEINILQHIFYKNRRKSYDFLLFFCVFYCYPPIF